MDDKNENKTLSDELAEGAEVPEEVTEDPIQEDEPVSDETILEALKTPSDAVKGYLQQLVNDAVKKVLAKNTPKRTPVKTEPITHEQFNKMSYTEREQLYNSNRPLYEKLKK